MNSKKTKIQKQLITNISNNSNSNSNASDSDNDKNENKHKHKHKQEQETEQNSEQNSETKKQLNRDFLDKVIKFIKTDDVIKKKEKENKEEIKVLKNEKKTLEKYILQFLDKIDENFISINGTGKLIKNESKTKGSIKIENIQEVIMETLKKEDYKLTLEPELILKLTNDIIQQVEEKRPVSKKIYLKRTTEKKKT